MFSAAPAAVVPPIIGSSRAADSTLSIQQAQAAAMPLTSVRNYSFVLADLNQSPEIEQIAQSNYDMLVVDPTATYKGSGNFSMAKFVARLRANDPSRVVLAYINIGEASSSRTYWQNSWQAPTGKHNGTPSYILERDPYGFRGNYPVAFWTPAWQNLFLGHNGIIQRVMKAGFDGVVLDWVNAYQDPAVAAAAVRAGVNAQAAMVSFVSRIRAVAQSIDPTADVVGMNAADLATSQPSYLSVIDGIIAENTWFAGEGGSPWGNPDGGDIAIDPTTTAADIASYQVFQNAGKPVFTLDYALDSYDVNYAYTQSSALGFIPLVTQVSVSQLTATPPPSLS
jgi:cysteinyl-tRNA synthetase